MIAESTHITKRNNNSKLVTVGIEELLTAIHDLAYCLTEKSRIEAAKTFWLNYKNDNRWIDTNGERSLLTQTVEMPEIYYQNGKLQICDGRHRVIAYSQLGYTHVVCEL